MAWAEWTLMLPGPVTGMTDQMFSSQATAAVISMNAFDYSTVAELFPSKSDAALRPATNQRQRRRQPVGYGRFARAGYAIRFAIEELPAELLSDTCLKVDEQIFDGHAIRRLYDSEDYPLVRRPSPLQASNVKPFPRSRNSCDTPAPSRSLPAGHSGRQPNTPSTGVTAMTNTDMSPATPVPPPSINDNLPTSNPPLWVVLTVLGSLALIALVLTFHSTLGF